MPIIILLTFVLSFNFNCSFPPPSAPRPQPSSFWTSIKVAFGGKEIQPSYESTGNEICKSIHDSLPRLLRRFSLSPHGQTFLWLSVVPILVVLLAKYVLSSSSPLPTASTASPTRRKAARNNDIDNAKTPAKTTREKAKATSQVLLERVETLEREVLGAIAGRGGRKR